MFARINWKLVSVAALAAAAVIGRSTGWLPIGILGFGLLNVFATAPGTRGVRVVAVAASIATLLSPSNARPVMTLFAWWLWPTAYFVAWALAREVSGESPDSARRAASQRARVVVAIVILAVAAGSLAYRAIVHTQLQQTAALFVGIPTLMALMVTLTVSPRTATGVACKAVTVGLLISVIFLGEGALCIAMSAPLFYGVAVVVAGLVEMARGGNGPRRVTKGTALLVFLPMSLEGVSTHTSFDRDEIVTVTRAVPASPEQVEHALYESPRFDRVLPQYLRMGFPRPISTAIDRTLLHPRWVIRLRGGETRLNGTEPKMGDLVLELDDARPGYMHWRALADGSHMTHFLRWRESTVAWREVNPGVTEITWTLRYRRGLDPAWYFGPWERYAVGLAAEYLIDAVATP
jgi:hypothetical protein